MNIEKLAGVRHFVAPLLVALVASSTTMAEEQRFGQGMDIVDYNQVFAEAPTESVSWLSESQMTETKGEVMPFILGVVAVDLALAGFFWGVYVPNYASGGGGGGSTCPVCYIPKPYPR